MPAQPVAAVFRNGMEAALRAALPSWHAQVPDACWRQKWVVDIQHVGHGEAAIKYLARYVQRTAISDKCIVELSDDRVRFRYRDSATGEPRVCTLEPDALMRRYLQHVLPSGIHRVRYFGWEHPAAWRRRRIVETLLQVVITLTEKIEIIQWHLICPHCQTETLCYESTLPRCRAPPRRCA